MKEKTLVWLKKKIKYLVNWAFNNGGYLEYDRKKDDYDYNKRVK